MYCINFKGLKLTFNNKAFLQNGTSIYIDKNKCGAQRIVRKPLYEFAYF